MLFALRPTAHTANNQQYKLLRHGSHAEQQAPTIGGCFDVTREDTSIQDGARVRNATSNRPPQPRMRCPNSADRHNLAAVQTGLCP